MGAPTGSSSRGSADEFERQSVKLHSDPISDANRITAYGPGYISVNNERIASSVVVTPTGLLKNWAPEDFEDIAAACLDVLNQLDAEVALLGTGASQQFPPHDLLARLAARGIGLEVMDTAAACRTYNILMAEGRTVVAMLLPIRS